MTVAELMAELQQCDPDATVQDEDGMPVIAVGRSGWSDEDAAVELRT